VATVYVETSVFGALVDTRRDAASRDQHEETVAWWESRDRYDLYISQAVLDELADGSYPGQEMALRLAFGIPLLEITEKVESLSDYYRSQMLMQAKQTGDAMHLAVASIYKVDYLLTWNCRHLANVNKIDRIKAIHDRLDVFTPQILTPPMLE
jgi:predicted nucleic acid-binding protein